MLIRSPILNLSSGNQWIVDVGLSLEVMIKLPNDPSII